MSKKLTFKWKKEPYTGKTIVTQPIVFTTKEDGEKAYTKLMFNYAKLARLFAISKCVGWFKTIIIVVMAMFMIFG